MNQISLDKLTSWKVLVPVVMVAALAMMAATFVAKSNADYICTRIIADESACAIDEWSAWTDAGNGDPETDMGPGETYEVVQSRVGTGTKILSRVIEYLNRRTSCTAGFSQTGYGQSDGDSGYIGGGKTFTTSAVCQIEETRTIARKVPDADDPECAYVGASGCDEAIIGEVTTVETTGAVITGGDEQSLDGLDAISDFRRTMIDAQIAAVPALLRDGDMTEVRWNSRETTSCSVSGDNGDAWSPVSEERDTNGNVVTSADTRTSGVEQSSPIAARTVYTLTCTAFDGSTITDTAVVDRIPVWNEQ